MIFILIVILGVLYKGGFVIDLFNNRTSTRKSAALAAVAAVEGRVATHPPLMAINNITWNA